jgi:hypothetical protein
MALRGRAFRRYIAEGAAGIKGVSGIMHKDIIECVIGTAKRYLEFFAGAERSYFAQVHDRDTITMALRFLKVMCGEKQGRTEVIPQINEMFPDSVARNRVQPNSRLV